MHTGKHISSKNDFDIIECQECGFKHINPIPTMEELEKVYQDEYYSSEKPLYIERYKQDEDWWNLCYDDRLVFFERHLGLTNEKTILDIGSGPGLFLKRAQNHGWTAQGVEPSKQAWDYSVSTLGLQVENEFYNQNLAEKLSQYHVIHLSDVLEHITDPAAMVKLTRENLVDGGLICIVVPNDYNGFQEVAAKMIGKSWWEAPPHHINYFTPSSLGRLLEKQGFKVIHKEMTFPIDMFLLMGKNYIGNDQLGRECHSMRMEFEKNLSQFGSNDLKRKFYQALAGLEIGREIIMYAQKV